MSIAGHRTGRDRRTARSAVSIPEFGALLCHVGLEAQSVNWRGVGPGKQGRGTGRDFIYDAAHWVLHLDTILVCNCFCKAENNSLHLSPTSPSLEKPAACVNEDGRRRRRFATGSAASGL